MSKLRDKLATLVLAEDVQAPGQTDDDFLSAIQALGFQLSNPEQALRGQQWGKLGALDLLNTDGFFGQLLGYTDKTQAVNFIFQTIDTLDNGLGEFPQYNKLGDSTKNKLKMALMKNRKVEDMAFTLSNFGLKGSGNGVVAELEDEELEKKASILVAEFEGRVRELLGLSKK